MTDKTPPEEKTLTDDEREANRRFQDTVGRLVNTPHTPHKQSAAMPQKTGAKRPKAS